jgi:hypothetical protein
MDSFSLESTLPHSYYNTVHGASPDKHICMSKFNLIEKKALDLVSFS